MSQSYTEHPKSITELRAEKSGRAMDWTVRDMLIEALRDIDSGKMNPYMAVLVINEGTRENHDAKNRVWRSQAGVVSYVETLGLLMRAIQISDPDKP